MFPFHYFLSIIMLIFVVILVRVHLIQDLPGQILLLISLDATFNVEIEQMNIKTTFIHGDIEQEIYIKKHEGFPVKGGKDLV